MPAASQTEENADVIVFQGGEPLLHDGLAASLSAAKKRGARTVVQTNGRLLPTLLPRLCEAGLDGVDVSLHGSTVAMHDLHTQTPGSFEETCSGIRAAVASGIEVGTTTVVTRSNMRHLAEILTLSHSLGARAAHLVGVMPHGRALSNALALVPHAELLAPQLARAKSTADALGLRLVLGSPSDPLFAGLGAVA